MIVKNWLLASLLLCLGWIESGGSPALAQSAAQKCEQASGDTAIAACTELIRNNKNASWAFYNRGAAWAAKGDHDRAIADYDEAIRLNPKDADALYNRGLASAAKGDHDKAIKDYSAAIWLDPTAADAFYYRGLSYEKKREFELALSDFRSFGRLAPNDPDGRGAIARIEGRLNAVAARAQQQPNQAFPRPEATAANPPRPIAVNDTVSAALRCHNEDRRAAIEACNEAIRLNPNGSTSYNNRGVAHRDLGEHDQAIRDFTVAIGLDPRFGRAYFNRARAYEAKGDFVNALSDMRDYVSKGDSTPNRVESEGRPALQRLERIVAALSNTTAQPSTSQQTLINGMPSPAIPDQGRRVALIIGNARYQHAARLENPTNDADLLASSLRSVGFQSVTVKKDLTREETLRALREFREIADAADWAVVHYAGHGIEFGGVNYLVPIEARLRSDRDIDLEAITVSTVVSAIEGARKLRLVVLDACRDNPFASQMRRTIASRSLGRGLAQMEPQAGTLIAYAAKAGEVADDGAGSKNSPFAAALAKRLQQSPPLEVRRLFDFVRDDVMEMTRNKQQPFTYGSLTARENYFFATR